VVAFTLRMPVGWPGYVNRALHATVQTEMIDPAAPPTSYGVMLIMDAATGTVRPATATDTAAGFAGFYVRPWPTQGGGITTGPVNDPLGGATPHNSGPCDVLKRGYMIVQLNSASPAVVKGQPVGVFIGTPSAGNPAGGVSGAAVDATHLAVPNSFFMGPADANGMTEISYNL
jgi:hypothetical protein